MIKILFADEDISVCCKPRGVLSEGEGSDCLPSMLSKTLGEKYTVYPVHRLDRDTEGIMVYALNKKAAAELSRQITEGMLGKEYVAELCGVFPEEEGTLRDLLFYDRRQGRSYVVKKERKGVKEAVLDYRVIGRSEKSTKVRIRLHTGRTHQIRVQFASRGFPLMGDRRYGAPAGSGELALTSCYLSFAHPTTKAQMEFSLDDDK